jgi:hypothetical protein
VAVLAVAFFTNISESKFRNETKDKLETVAGKIVDEQHNALLSFRDFGSFFSFFCENN